MGELIDVRSTMWSSARRLALALAMLLSLAPSFARAQIVASPDARARELYLQGDREYQAGRYEQAVAAFQEAYRLSGRPLLLFNLANAYERLGRYAEALEALRGYLPNASLAERAQVEARIASLETRAQQAGSTSARGGDDALLVTGIAVGGAGLALGVGGVVFGVLALDARGRAQEGCASTGSVTVCDASAREALDQDALFAILADVGIVVGAAAVAAGVVLAILGVTSGGSSERALIPWVAPRADGGELGVAGTF